MINEEWSIGNSTHRVYLPEIIMTICALVFIAFIMVSSYFIIRTTDAIANISNAANSTALMCAERLVNEIETKEERKTMINALQRENLFLRGKLETFNKLYKLTNDSYKESEGTGGP
ncbi:hypothetical protein LCGC14_1835500 [marine sediment metagenome]|uniref:Uncharacterized protein n=1 Tax=marine sediment metagenome TaxID=412755 RepID=A0A0F9IUA3_9ZZZZ